MGFQVAGQRHIVWAFCQAQIQFAAAQQTTLKLRNDMIGCDRQIQVAAR